MKDLRSALGLFALLLAILLPPLPAGAQQPITFATVDRPPFAEQTPNGFDGFSIDLMNAIANEIGRPIRYQRVARFPQMFTEIENGSVDGAVGNISITAAREEVLDFSQPIFAAGLRVMVPPASGSSGILHTLLSRDLLMFLLGAVIFLAAGGMAMWAFERRGEPYFARPAREALFPSFWWALNLVVNGGFEERVPRTRAGRFFAVILVVSSLFIVSIFVAKITAALTVSALSGSINSLSDLDGRSVATINGSTAAAFLNDRGIAHDETETLDALLKGFSDGKYEAVVFDGPILAWYLQTAGRGKGRLLPQVFKPENYGIALPTGSPLTEDINRALLSLRESGRYDEIRAKWFGYGN